MLKDSLYIITNINHQNGSINATLQLDEHHQIFNGHFPGQPVLPGACMLQMVREILTDVLAIELQMKQGSNIKFLQLINPQDNNLVELNINYKYLNQSELQVSANLLSENNSSFKFNGLYSIKL